MKENEVLNLRLNTGALMPAIGLGTALKQQTLEALEADLRKGIEIGYRHFDTSSVYQTEHVLGKVLQDVVNSDTLIRQDLFITTKLSFYDTHPDDVIPALRKSLSALQLEYVDMYLIHLPIRFKRFSTVQELFSYEGDDQFLPLDLVGVWKVMEQCVQLGLTKAIGVSNFGSRLLRVITADAKIIPAVNEVEMHPGCLQPKLLDTCKDLGTVLIAFNALVSPTMNGTGVLDSAILKEIAEKHGKSVAQISLRWILDHGAGVLTKSSNPANMAENLCIFGGWTLDEEDHRKIELMPRFRNVTGETLCNQTTSPYRSPKDIFDDWYE